MASMNKTKYALIFFLFFITCGYFFQGGGWNQNTRVCLTRAIIHQQSFIIDPYKEDSRDPFFEFVNTGDWSFKDGHYYSNKSPGLSMLAVLPFAATEFTLKNLSRFDTEKQVHLSAYASTLCTTVVCAGLLALLVFHVCNFFFGFSTRQSLLLTIFCSTGTLIFSYSTTFYCHVPSAFFSLLSLVLAMHLKHGTAGKKNILGTGSGLAASMAVLIEPSTVFILCCIFIYLLSFQDGRKAALFFLTGCMPAGALQMFYNVTCFGNPFLSGFNFPNPDVMWYKDGKLFGIPTPGKLIKIIFFPYRGILFSSPVLLMMIPGSFLLLKIKKWRFEAIVCMAISFVLLIFIASFYAWHGGSAVGPRYLLPAYPFAFLLTVFAFKKFPKSYSAIGIFSILINLSITVVGNEIPGDVKNPLVDVVWPNILKGNVSINPVPFSNFSNYPHIYKLADIKTWPHNFNSFNLGEVFFPNQMASLLPLLCFWIIWAFIWHHYIKNNRINLTDHPAGQKICSQCNQLKQK